LDPLLKSGNPECLKYTDELRLILGSEELVEQMEDLYFGSAANLLVKLRIRLEDS